MLSFLFFEQTNTQVLLSDVCNLISLSIYWKSLSEKSLQTWKPRYFLLFKGLEFFFNWKKKHNAPRITFRGIVRLHFFTCGFWRHKQQDIVRVCFSNSTFSFSWHKDDKPKKRYDSFSAIVTHHLCDGPFLFQNTFFAALFSIYERGLFVWRKSEPLFFAQYPKFFRSLQFELCKYFSFLTLKA